MKDALETIAVPVPVRNAPSRSSKVNDVRVMWKGLCYFLLVING